MNLLEYKFSRSKSRIQITNFWPALINCRWMCRLNWWKTGVYTHESLRYSDYKKYDLDSAIKANLLLKTFGTEVKPIYIKPSLFQEVEDVVQYLSERKINRYKNIEWVSIDNKEIIITSPDQRKLNAIPQPVGRIHKVAFVDAIRLEECMDILLKESMEESFYQEQRVEI